MCVCARPTHKTTTLLLVTLLNIHLIFNFFFSNGLRNKPFLTWLLTASPHLQYVADYWAGMSPLPGGR